MTPIRLALLLAATALSACAQTEAGGPVEATSAAAVTPPVAVSAPSREAGVYAFRIGTLDAMVLHDATGKFPNDGKILAINAPAGAVAELLASKGLPSDMLELDVQGLLVRSGDRIVLLDTGYGLGGPGGKLAANLQRAGIMPAEVTDIIISHAHGDHVGGLANAGGSAFPNARIRMTEAEWTAFKANPQQAALVAAITSQVETFAPGAVILPGMTSVAVRGHTPGHTGVEIVSGAERLLTIGDSAHHSVISLRHPEWRIAFDGDAPLAEASRRALLKRATDERLRLFSPHFPFPGLGYVKAEGDGFAWEPAA